MRRVLAILVLLMLGLSSVHAQDYRFEFGPALGMSGYLGDLNRSNMYKHPGVAGGGIFRYIANSRWAVKGNLLYAGLKGNSNNKNVLTDFAQGLVTGSNNRISPANSSTVTTILAL